METTHKLYRVKEAAELLAVSVSTLYVWMAEKKITTVKLGKSTRFAASEIERIQREGVAPVTKPAN